MVVEYPMSGESVIAADPGDYIYPSDVRMDVRNDLLYTKAHGLAGGISEQTWLFEYNIRNRQITGRARITNGALTAKCAAR